jgi:hypothetical protein
MISTRVPTGHTRGRTDAKEITIMADPELVDFLQNDLLRLRTKAARALADIDREVLLWSELNDMIDGLAWATVDKRLASDWPFPDQTRDRARELEERFRAILAAKGKEIQKRLATAQNELAVADHAYRHGRHPGYAVARAVEARAGKPYADHERRLAFHEAGHAVICHAAGVPEMIGEVSIEPRNHPTEAPQAYHQPARFRHDDNRPRRLRAAVASSFGGWIAECFACGMQYLVGTTPDYRNAYYAARVLQGMVVDHEEDPDFLRPHFERALELAKKHWAKVERLAAELLERRLMSGDEVRKLLAE